MGTPFSQTYVFSASSMSSIGQSSEQGNTTNEMWAQISSFTRLFAQSEKTSECSKKYRKLWNEGANIIERGYGGLHSLKIQFKQRVCDFCLVLEENCLII